MAVPWVVLWVALLAGSSESSLVELSAVMSAHHLVAALDENSDAMLAVMSVEALVGVMAVMSVEVLVEALVVEPAVVLAEGLVATLA